MNPKVGEDYLIEFSTLLTTNSRLQKNVRINSAYARVYNPQGMMVGFPACKIKGDTVSCIVENEWMNEVGIYTAVFTLSIKDVGDRKNVVEFQIEHLPTKRNIEAKEAVGWLS